MLTLPNMLLIGAADRNVGKTNFACSLIRKYSNSRPPAARTPVVAAKITVIKEKGDKCPRGGQGCGVCTSLSSDFLITEELNSTASKDTSKMLAAGATKTFWLRVLASDMEEGVKALLRVIRDAVECESMIICESNSIRNVIEPGLFVVLKKVGKSYIKPSCSDVIGFADKIVHFDFCKKYSIDLNKFCFSGSRWFFKEDATAIVLAGGKSLRIGTDKGLLPVNGKTMIEHIVLDQLDPNFNQILIGSNDSRKYSFLGFDVISDEKTGQGPLMGILSCLEHSKNELNFITACDMPDINMNLVRRMLFEICDYDIIIPITGDGLIEPLFGVYKKEVGGAIRHIICNSKKRKIRVLFDNVKTKYFKVDKLDCFKNINTKNDYNNYLKNCI